MSNWVDLYLQLLGMDSDFKIIVPLDLMPGEEEGELLIRYCKQEGVLSGNDPEKLVINWERAAELDENLVKFFKAMNEAETLSVLQNLEEDGLIYSTVDKHGNMIYGLTSEGKEYVKSMPEDN